MDKMIEPRILSQRHVMADLGLPLNNEGGPEHPCIGMECETDEERWDKLKQILHVMLAGHPEGLSLALLKNDIEKRFKMVLDQSVFHEVKLSHVFMSPKLRTDFEVRRVAHQGGGSQIVVRQKDLPMSMPTGQEKPCPAL